MNLQLLTPAARGAWLEHIRGDIGKAEHFVLVTAFATPDGIALLEPAMRTCLNAGGQGTVIIALDKQHFNAAEVFGKLATLMEAFPEKLEVRIVRENAGLMHAKAVFAKLPDGTATLLVGSANLTERAFTHNHELGLWADLTGQPEVIIAFQLFAQSLGGKRLDAAGLHRLGIELGVRRPPVDRGTPPEQPIRVWEDLINTKSGPPWPPVSVETFVGDWLRAGYIVGRGRRGLGVLVIRTPGKQLESLGLIKREANKKIAAAIEKKTTAGYGLRLLPDAEDERLRKDARKTQIVLGKLTLNLPCFGYWMPRAYWDTFEQAADKIQLDGISTSEIFAAATQRRHELDGHGIEVEVDAIIADLQGDGLATSGREGELRDLLLDHFLAQLANRTPELLARAVGFRTGKQALDSDLDLRTVARSFFVDLVQSTFTAAYRTGAWPGHFRSFVGRELAGRIRKRCLAEGEKPSDDLALRLLDGTARWEDERVGFETVTAEVNKLLGEPDDFVAVTMEELLNVDPEEGGDINDD